ncbi:hypothetical protein KSF_108690 [Reticulibacter mediterranei]|uniref:Uncharacterized protein n=1 Tax=Reticulibacter mediterranei TaxID=2778369 RepID=A0A8J3J500_9CHLR|nr:hypothetical protein [Reticulibacter mediterranei]GHP00822.1 hypothetical protein KSF_108690 [Reticulibacter mediterranei]
MGNKQLRGWKFRGATLEDLQGHLTTPHYFDPDDPFFFDEPKPSEQGQDLACLPSATPDQHAFESVQLVTGPTAWNVQLRLSEGTFATQWYLPFLPGEFPHAPGTFFWFHGDPYLLQGIAGCRTLRVFALSRALDPQDDPEDFLVSLCDLRRLWGKRANAFKKMTPLQDVSFAQPDFDQIAVHYCYQVEAMELPADLYERLPEDTRRCYVRFVSPCGEAGYFAKVAQTPKQLAEARAIPLAVHDAQILASVIQDAQMLPIKVQDIRVLPVYLLPGTLRSKVSTSLSFLLSIPGSHTEAAQYDASASMVGSLISVQMERIQQWARDTSSALFDIAYIAVTDDVSADGLRRVEVAAFVDRLTGSRSGSVYECWLDQDTIAQALPWTPAFDRHSSHVRRVQATAYALAHGAARPTVEDITKALPRPRAEEQEELAFMASKNIPIPTPLIQPLLEAADKSKHEPCQGDLIRLARLVVQQAYDERRSGRRATDAHADLLEFIDLAEGWMNRQRVQPRIIGFGPAYEEQMVERTVEIIRYDNPSPKRHESFKRVMLERQYEQRIEQRYHLVGYHLVIGVPLSVKIPPDVDLETVLQVPRREKIWGQLIPKEVLHQ